jgi:surface antigen
MLIRKPFVALIVALPLLGACESNPSKQDIGMATGAILGGVLGNQVGHGAGRAVATVGGAALGGFLGSRLGGRMDREDQLKASGALERSRDGLSTSWRNPNNGQIYSVTPTRTYDGASGPCREFTTTTDIDGREEVVHGTACRQPDGTWKAA